jgi:predicted Rossmann-fold nucleotide-binding protein
VLFDSAYWRSLLDWMRERLLADRMISPWDFELLRVTDSVEEAVATVLERYEQAGGQMPAEPQKADAQ